MTTAWDQLTDEQRREITELVDHYKLHHRVLSNFLLQVRVFLDNEKLSPFIHSTKSRLKDADHLRLKLARKYLQALTKSEAFSITRDNLFQRVTDLVGMRVLHLHTRQMKRLHPLILDAFDEAQVPLVEPPFARTWDDESREFFQGLGLKTEQSPSFYTSVHYVIQSNSKTVLTAEIQVRTLAEELWGEVDHAINYPEPCELATCREQIKVLARVTSSCTRLVDSIFDAHATLTSPPQSNGEEDKASE